MINAGFCKCSDSCSKRLSGQSRILMAFLSKLKSGIFSDSTLSVSASGKLKNYFTAVGIEPTTFGLVVLLKGDMKRNFLLFHLKKQ